MGGLARLVSGLFLAGLSYLSSGCEKSSWMEYELERQQQVWIPQEEQKEDPPILRSSLIDYGELPPPIIDDVELADVLRKVILSGYMNKRDEVAEQRLDEMFAILGIEDGREKLLQGRVPQKLQEIFGSKKLVFESALNNGVLLARMDSWGAEFDFEGKKIQYLLVVVTDVVIPTKVQFEAKNLEKWMRKNGKKAPISTHVAENYKGNIRFFYYPEAAERSAEMSFKEIQDEELHLEAILAGKEKADENYFLYSLLLRYISMRDRFRASNDAKEYHRKTEASINASTLSRLASEMYDDIKEEKLTYWVRSHQMIRGYLRALKGTYIPHYVCGNAAYDLSHFMDNKETTNRIHQKLYKYTVTDFFKILGKTYRIAPSKYESIQMDNTILNKTFRIMDALRRCTPTDLRRLGDDTWDRTYGKEPFPEWIKKNQPRKPPQRRVPRSKVPA